MSFVGERSGLSRNQGILGFVTSWAALCNKASGDNNETNTYQALETLQNSCSLI